MITLAAPLIVNPQPTIEAPGLPRIVLFDCTRSMPEHAMLPEIRITAALLDEIALVRADALVTVVAGALPPPGVPPFCVAQPARPVCGCEGGGSDEGGSVGVAG